MPDFAIVDTHVHLYDPSVIIYPWMAKLQLLNSLHGSDEYSAAVADVVVDKLVFVEVDAAPGQHLAEARFVHDLAKRDKRIQAVVASIPLENGKAAESDIAEFAKMPLARDVRRLIQGHVAEPGWCLRPDFVEGVRLVGEYGLGFEIGIRHPQMRDAIALVRRFPDMRFVLDHIGKPGIKDGLSEPWRTEIRELAGLPNVICKVSGVVTEAEHKAWTYDQIAPYISHAIDCFGFDRVVFGGDWPVMELATRYPRWVEIVDRIIAGASAADLRMVYRDNAIRHYRL